MDDASNENVKILKDAGERFIMDNVEILDNIVKSLTA